MIEIRDRVGEVSWGKLYESVDDDEEEISEEWKEALEEANYYNNEGCVDEAVDISCDFGI